MLEKKCTSSVKVFATLIICFINVHMFGQEYVNDMDYVLGDTKQAFITNVITTETHADNLLLGFEKMGVNGVRIPLFGRDLNGVDLNPNKPMMDYFYNKAIAQGFEIFANPAQGGGGHRVANNRLNGNGANEGEDSSVKGVQAATDELIARVLEFSNEYPDCKWINPFNEDGRATSSTWSVSQINTIYAALYNNVNGAELIGPCTWGLPAAIDVFKNTDITDYITVAASHNLGFNHNLWDDFIALADAENLPVWDSEVNHNDAKGNGTRLEKAIENKVDGLVLYNSWNTINLADGTINASAQNQMLLYLKDYTIPVPPVYTNLALDGIATQSSTNPSWNMDASLAIDGNTAGSFASGKGSITLTNGEANPWWQVDLGADNEIGNIKIYNRTDSCCKARLSDFTVTVTNNSGVVTYSKTFTIAPDPSITIETGNVLGRVVKVQSNITETLALSLAEVQVFSPESDLSTNIYNDIDFSIYPNPVVDKLKIITTHSVFNEIVLLNIQGQVVLRTEFSNKEKEIDMSTFLNGMYVLELRGNKLTRRTKILKK